ncbi:ABC transporter permease [Phytoactinopolyspora halotolerans]|uniref:ABC transporter permease n=1 Tax=Phytoactinopolyspora halotolerans TaxID=1981512 RepID=A0A6L9SF13_9ACTN|nr:ABC transporter permease [Phytoactinopolyspora halotolerans]NEE03679.1 ABC transporter permease [Phytoactinopolyspora halotolerans]
MTGYVIRRLVQSVIVLIGVSILVFAIVHLVPGDPIRLALGTRGTEETYQAMRERAGLDEPLVVQYFQWIGSALTGDLGVSFRTGQPVANMISERVPATLSLAAAAIVVALLIAVPLGTLSALKPRSPVDWFATVSSQAGLSIPDFWMGIMFILLFAGTLGWLPSGGYVGFTEDPVQWARHLIMPAVTAGVASGSIMTRFVRSSVLEALGQDYVRTARAKGMRARDVMTWHVLRNALVPLVTVGGVQLAYLLSGVVIVEIVFAWPGLGQMALQAVEARDYSLLQGTVLLFAVIFLVVNLVVDLLYAKLDPRISYEQGAAR